MLLMGAKGALGVYFEAEVLPKPEFATMSGNYVATNSLQMA